MSNQLTQTIQRYYTSEKSGQRLRTTDHVRTRRKSTFSNSRISMLNRAPKGPQKLPRKRQIRNTVIYGLNAWAHRTPGSPSQVWRRIAKPASLGAEIRWALGPRGFKSHSRRHHASSDSLQTWTDALF